VHSRSHRRSLAGVCAEAPALNAFPLAPLPANDTRAIFFLELNRTAEALLATGALLSMFVNRANGATRAQFGDPALQVRPRMLA